MAVGPIAKAIVTDAAQKTDDLYELYQVLAQRIEDEKVKQEFLAAAPETASPQSTVQTKGLALLRLRSGASAMTLPITIG